MIDGISFFVDTPRCFELRSQFLRSFGRVSPYIFRTPTPFTAQQLRVVGENGRKILKKASTKRPLHVIGIASRGVPLASAITIALADAPTSSAKMSIIGRDGSAEHVALDEPGFTVLVDNAIVSGITAERILAKLASMRISIDLMVRLFDREELDRDGLDVADEISRGFNCAMSSIFSFRDLIAVLPDGPSRDEMINYGMEFGTPSLRAHLERT